MPAPFDMDKACRTLAVQDDVMAGLIKTLPPMKLKARRQGTPFEALLRAISGQQLSVKAAATIHGRVLALFEQRKPKPQALLDLPEDDLRGAGLSGNKTRAVRDLAAKTLDGTVPGTRKLNTLDDEEIIRRLVEVHGIGRWTAEMLLIFQLGRPDVLPVDDLGVRRGYMFAYGQDELPKPKALAKSGEVWAPYRSVASWYLWRASESTPV